MHTVMFTRSALVSGLDSLDCLISDLAICAVPQPRQMNPPQAYVFVRSIGDTRPDSCVSKPICGDSAELNGWNMCDRSVTVGLAPE